MVPVAQWKPRLDEKNEATGLDEGMDGWMKAEVWQYYTHTRQHRGKPTPGRKVQAGGQVGK